MVISTYNKFNATVQAFANGLIQASTGGTSSTGGTFNGHTFSFILTNTQPTSTWRTSTDNTAISAGNGYAALGATCALISSTLGSTSVLPTPVTVLGSTVTIIASSANSTAGIGPFRYLLLVDQTASAGIPTSTGGVYLPSGLQQSTFPTGAWLVSWYDYGIAVTLTPGQSFTISPDGSSGLFQLA